MKKKQQYAQQLADLMVDLSEAINTKDDVKVSEIVQESRALLDDIEEANY